MGGEKYVGTPAPTKPEAQQVVASVADASLPPVCAAGRREGEEGGISCGIHKCLCLSLSHTHTHCYIGTTTILSIIWLSTTTSPVCSSSSPLSLPSHTPHTHWPLLLLHPQPLSPRSWLWLQPQGTTPNTLLAPPFVPLQIWMHMHKR